MPDLEPVTPESGISRAKEHRTVTRVMTILETVAAARDGVSLGALVAELDAAKSSVHGLVKGLVAIGYLQEEERVYRLGPAVTFLLAPKGPHLGLGASARPIMKELQGSFDETVMLGTRVGESVVYVEAVESSQLIRYSPPFRHRRPLWPTSTGKCFLAHAAPERAEAYLREHLSDPADREAAAAELDSIREQGFAINRGETLPDISAVGSPIISQGRVLACFAIAGPTLRMADKLEDASEAVRDAAERLVGRG